MNERYARIYWAVMDDPKFDGIRENMRHFGSWSLLLVTADMAWPASAYVPPVVPKASFAALQACGLVDPLSGGRYRIHGLDVEREARSESARNAAAMRWHKAGNATRNAETMPSRAEQEQEQEQSTSPAQPNDPWDDPEGEAVTWLARHGCDIPPHSGYYRHLVTMVEAHGIHAVIGMFDRLADAGTKAGDVKGYVFAARDALDSKTRPSLVDIAKAERSDDMRKSTQRAIEKTRQYIAELKGADA